MWLDYSFEKVFGLTEPLTAKNADFYFDCIEKKLTEPDFLPRSLFDQFNIEVSMTDPALSNLEHHNELSSCSWNGRIIPTHRPDGIIDPEYVGFKNNLEKLGASQVKTLNPGKVIYAHRLRDYLKYGGDGN